MAGMAGNNRLTQIEERLFGRAYSTLESELRVDPRLARALDLVEVGLGSLPGHGVPLLQHGFPEINVDRMARAAGLSRTAFGRELRQRTGYAPHQFLIRRRVLHAARMICDTERTLTEIAEESGFSSIGAMERNFRRLLGIAPGSLRRPTFGTGAENLSDLRSGPNG